MKTCVRHIEHIFGTCCSHSASDASYPASSLILMFFTFSSAGWLWEVALHLVLDRRFVNRGLLTGPWLPIYGVGGILVLLLLKRWKERPLQLFGWTMVMCGVIEYFSGLCLETMFGVRWWNYSQMRFQIHGRVCLTGLVIFGAGGLFITYIAAPALHRYVRRMPDFSKEILCTGLCLIFTVDLICSLFSPNMGAGITSL